VASRSVETSFEMLLEEFLKPNGLSPENQTSDVEGELTILYQQVQPSVDEI
jgi:hypothetical protein